MKKNKKWKKIKNKKKNWKNKKIKNEIIKEKMKKKKMKKEKKWKKKNEIIYFDKMMPKLKYFLFSLHQGNNSVQK